jgi:hypothetical protein
VHRAAQQNVEHGEIDAPSAMQRRRGIVGVAVEIGGMPGSLRSPAMPRASTGPFI